VVSDRCPGFVYATMLREPVARLNSQRIFSVSNKEKTGKPGKLKMKFRQLNWLGLLRKRLGENKNKSVAESGFSSDKDFHYAVAQYDNYYVRHVANLLSVPLGGLKERHLQRAMDILTDFDVVGISEDMRDARKGALLYERLNWTLPTKALSGQTNSMDEYKKQVDTAGWLMTSSEEDWVKELNRWDLQLYQWAVDNFGIK